MGFFNKLFTSEEPKKPKAKPNAKAKPTIKNASTATPHAVNAAAVACGASFSALGKVAARSKSTPIGKRSKKPAVLESRDKGESVSSAWAKIGRANASNSPDESAIHLRDFENLWGNAIIEIYPF